MKKNKFKKGQKFFLEFKIVDVNNDEGEEYYEIKCKDLKDVHGISINVLVDFKDLEKLLGTNEFKFENRYDEISPGVYVVRKNKNVWAMSEADKKRKGFLRVED